MIRQLRFWRVAEVRQSSLRSNLGHIRDRIYPSCHLLPRKRLQQVLLPLLRIQLEHVRPFIVDKVRHFGTHDGEHQRRFSRRRELELCR